MKFCFECNVLSHKVMVVLLVDALVNDINSYFYHKKQDINTILMV
ncbi:hypothetical protein MCC93_04290 [Morococcus cerebrosus]|uniref:Uncharacterized protein n=1 Tax=Morococcus cerebrosus TaxID=1056807 RepID=A0A0C1H249_9NEIS|nr:hypothetical protein MCC93_04290 [Morococcus cerebrosus]